MQVKTYLDTSLVYRLCWMAMGWGTVGILYFVSDVLGQTGQVAVVLPLTWVDRILPFATWAFWPYMSFFVLIPVAYLYCPLERVKSLAFAMQCSAGMAALVYWLYPTTMIYPSVVGNTLNDHAFLWLVSIDSAQNCLPSLHAGLSLLAVWALRQQKNMSKQCFLWLWFVLISLSIIMLRRHLFVDWFGGCALAWASIWMVQSQCPIMPNKPLFKRAILTFGPKGKNST